MSAVAANKSAESNLRKPLLTEGELQAEATAIAKIAKQIQDAGASAPKDLMAEFAKRQKAYLDRKIEFEKHKRDSSTGTPVTKPESAAAPKPAETPALKPSKPSELTKPARPSEVSRPEEKKQVPAKRTDPEAKSKPADAKKITRPESKSVARLEKSASKPAESQPEKSPAKSGGISPVIWILLAATIAVVAWYFASQG